jgi:Arc/MetJ-type ribon-helix-helix transcriptional regulator
MLVGKGANNSDGRRIDLRLTAELAAYVEGLARLGLFGGSAAEVIRYFVTDGVKRAVQERMIEHAIRDRELLGRVNETS